GDDRRALRPGPGRPQSSARRRADALRLQAEGRGLQGDLPRPGGGPAGHRRQRRHRRHPVGRGRLSAAGLHGDTRLRSADQGRGHELLPPQGRSRDRHLDAVRRRRPDAATRCHPGLTPVMHRCPGWGLAAIVSSPRPGKHRGPPAAAGAVDPRPADPARGQRWLAAVGSSFGGLGSGPRLNRWPAGAAAGYRPSMAQTHGTCSDRFSGVRETLEEWREAQAAGASVAVSRDGEPVVDLWGGYADAARTTPWQRDSILNTWSTTKTMTALCALILADRGDLDLTAPVARYWPEFAAAGKQDLEVRHLLSHTAGLP